MGLSWTGLGHIHRLLQEPLPPDAAEEQLTLRARIQPATAHRYLQEARALRLLREAGGRWIVLPAADPAELARSSALVRLFAAWWNLLGDPPPLQPCPDEAGGLGDPYAQAIRSALPAFQAIGEHRVTVLDTASWLSWYAEAELPALVPARAWLLEEMAACWWERRTTPETRVWDAVDAWEAWAMLTGESAEEGRRRFLDDCLLLYQRRRLNIYTVQYLLGTNGRYKDLRTSLGYLKSIQIQKQGSWDAQSLPEEAERHAHAR